MLETHGKKKLEIIVESPLVGRVLALIEEQGASGYTVLPGRAGAGHAGTWQEGQISSAFNMEMILVIADAGVAQSLLEAAHRLLRDYTAIILMSDVEVIRAEHF